MQDRQWLGLTRVNELSRNTLITTLVQLRHGLRSHEALRKLLWLWCLLHDASLLKFFKIELCQKAKDRKDESEGLWQTYPVKRHLQKLHT
jgi:hypothetical protein